MVGVHVDDIIVSGDQDKCDELFVRLKQRFSVKTMGELKMHTGCAFERDWDNEVLEMNQTAKTWWNSTTFPEPRTFRGAQV